MNETSKVRKELKREEVPQELVNKLYKKFPSLIVDLKKDYEVGSKNNVYVTQGQDEIDGVTTNFHFEIVSEPRYADIVAVVQIFETRWIP